MEKDICRFNRGNLKDYVIRLGLDPQECMDYLLSKKAVDIRPIHATSLQYLKPKPLVPSS